jgi:hypothetical protein
MYPAAEKSVIGVALVTAVFGTATIATMLSTVLALRYGLNRIRLGWLERHAHAVAGLTLCLCGALILLGL